MKERAIEIANMPKYRSKVEIHAVKILDTDITVDGGMILIPEERIEPFTVSKEFVERYSPITGGYFAVHEDGEEVYWSEKLFSQLYQECITEEAQKDFEKNQVNIEYTKYCLVAYSATNSTGGFTVGNIACEVKSKTPFLNRIETMKKLRKANNDIDGEIVFTFILEISKEEYEAWIKE